MSPTRKPSPSLDTTGPALDREANIGRFAGIGREALFGLLVILPDQAFGVAGQGFGIGNGGHTRGRFYGHDRGGSED